MSGTSTVEFHIKAKAGARNAFTLEVFQRGGSQPLGNTSFDYDLSFLTEYDVSNLDSGGSRGQSKISPYQPVAFGGLWKDENIDDQDIDEVRREMWQSLEGRGL